MELKEAIGKRLKEFRESLGLQQKEIVNGLGITYATWSNYENGISSPSPRVMEKLRRFWGLDLNWLMTGTRSRGKVETMDDFIDTFFSLPVYEVPAVSYAILDPDWFGLPSGQSDPTKDDAPLCPVIWIDSPPARNFLDEYREFEKALNKMNPNMRAEMLDLWKRKQKEIYKGVPLMEEPAAVDPEA